MWKDTFSDLEALTSFPDPEEADVTVSLGNSRMLIGEPYLEAINEIN